MEAAVTVAKQNGHCGIGLIGDDKIRLVISIYIKRHHKRGVFARSEHLTLAERTIAVAEKDGQVAVVAGIGVSQPQQNEVGPIVSVEICRRNTIAVRTCAKVHGCFERAVAVAQQYADASIAAIRGCQV